MDTFSYKGKVYEVDSMNFLMNSNDWDENFAEGLAPQAGIPLGLTNEHWEVIKTIRKYFIEEGDFPNIYETCSTCGFRIPEMRKLFPHGYWRGACKLAGVISWGGPLGPVFHSINLSEMKPFIEAYDKTYEIDVRGFLINPDDWDEYYAVYRAYEMKIHDGKLSDRHWTIIKFLRESFQQKREIPTIYETCEANQIDLEELEHLFPDGYHRGAVKLAGLRVGGSPSKRLKDSKSG
ncbi:MAG: sulfurtransferase TusE [Desulfobacca sp.]|nr:sulfurtransferase TusE [Desulfobacca sp.]